MSLKSQGLNRYGHLRLHIQALSLRAGVVCQEAARFIVRVYSLLGQPHRGFFPFLLHKPELRFDSNHRMAKYHFTNSDLCVVHTQALASVVDTWEDTESLQNAFEPLYAYVAEYSDFIKDVLIFKMLPGCPLLSSYKYFGCAFCSFSTMQGTFEGCNNFCRYSALYWKS